MTTSIQKSLLDDDLLPFAAEGKAQGKLESGLRTQYTQWQQSDTPQTRREMLKAVQPVLDRTVASYGDHPYLKGQAKKLAMQAIRTYDPQKGPLQSHVQAQLRGLQRLSARQNQIISVPEQIMLDRRDLLDSETALEDRLGRPPSMEELGNHTGLSSKRIAYIRGTGGSIPSSAMRDSSGEPIDPAVKSLHNEGPSIWERLVYEDLLPRDKVIYDYTLGTNGLAKLSNTQLAAKLGVSPAAISQRKAAIQQQLDQVTLYGMDE